MRALLIAAVVLGSSSISNAQIAIQQPVVGTTGVGTTVSVPDRGSVFLGGVSSAQAGRTTYGPLRTGTSRGFDLSSGSMSASVQIIDLNAMDEAILNSVPDSPQSMTMRNRSSQTMRSEVTEIVSPQQKVAKYERMAQQAEAAGKTGVAKLHWQMAAKYGSTLAPSKLDAKSSNFAAASSKK